MTSPIRRAVGGLLGLTPIDFAAAVAIAAICISLVAGPAFGASPSALPSVAPTPVASVGPSPAASPAVSPSPSAPCPLPDPLPTPAPSQTAPLHNLCPAVLKGADPFSFVAWIFTPIFQVLFMGLVFLYNVTRDIGIAIILLTLLIRVLLIPLFRKQFVSQRRMQMLQPELRAIQSKYKGNRTKISEEQMKLYKERGVNPLAGCLPTLLQLVLLAPMYQVFSQGLSAPDVSSMLSLGPIQLALQCQDPGNPNVPCINTKIPWLAWLPPGHPGGLDAHRPEVLFMIGIFGFSILATVSAVLQLIQTRMMTTQSDDPQARSQQRIFMIIPLISLAYGAFLPAGLFIYWITTTVFSIVQQFLIAGWGGLFPLFGWTPSFARNTKPRFPIAPYAPRVETATATAGASAPDRRTTLDSAAGTIRPARTKARTSRRGRRR